MAWTNWKKILKQVYNCNDSGKLQYPREAVYKCNDWKWCWDKDNRLCKQSPSIHTLHQIRNMLNRMPSTRYTILTYKTTKQGTITDNFLHLKEVMSKTICENATTIQSSTSNIHTIKRSIDGIQSTIVSDIENYECCLH
jgi:hypothetical protein